MIEIRDFSYRYPLTEDHAIRNVSFSVPPGEFVAVVGANGAGKSTLLNALAGFVPHFYGGEASGELLAAGHDLMQVGAEHVAGDIGLVFQNPFNQITGARFTVRDEIAFGLENLGVPPEEMVARVERMLAQTGLAETADRSPYSLSGGQQQRLALASVMVMEPKLLVLDEPTSQLDPAGTRAIFADLSQLTESGATTVVMAEHKLEWVAEFADQVIVLQSGRLVASGPAREILASETALGAGVGRTRYTQAAAGVRQAGLGRRADLLPVTLDQTTEFLR